MTGLKGFAIGWIDRMTDDGMREERVSSTRNTLCTRIRKFTHLIFRDTGRVERERRERKRNGWRTKTTRPE